MKTLAKTGAKSHIPQMTDYYSYEDLLMLVAAYLERHRVSAENAEITAEALVNAERDGQRGHGLSRLKSYAAQAEVGKIDGMATPSVEKLSPAAYRIDAKYGFAFPALKTAVETLTKAAEKSVIATASLYNSHHCGALGLQVEALAERGLIGLMFANSPKAIAPWGGNRDVFGTNPIAFAAPRKGAPPLVIDLSLSATARGKIMVAAEKGEQIPAGLALDKDGNPTTDAKAALAGTMLPLGGTEGGAKGAALVMMVEILSAALGGAQMGFEASPFLTAEGKPPATGQMLLAINPQPLSGNGFGERLESLIDAILSQENTRLPGENRLQKRIACHKHGIAVAADFYNSLLF